MQCAHCELDKPLSDFSRWKYRDNRCRLCINIYYRNRHKKKMHVDEKYTLMVRKCSKLQQIKRNKKFRTACLEHYGNKCACCGESIQRFLTLDHINNDGHKFKHTVGKRFAEHLCLNGFRDDIQILCYNCNIGRSHNGGICPHKDISFGDKPPLVYPS